MASREPENRHIGSLLLRDVSSSSSDSDAQDSDSSYESKLKRKLKKANNFQERQVKRQQANHDPNAKEGTNKYECKGCCKVFRSLASLFVHTSKCGAYQKRKAELTCNWCDKCFPSKSALALHAVEVHGDNSQQKDVIVDPVSLNPINNMCHICKRPFKSNLFLKYHIRGTHFNLVGKAPYAHEKKVNQVWFEKVLNSNSIIEIKKTKHNTLVMKKMNENTSIKVNDDNERIIDVSHVYPTGRSDLKVTCQYCNKRLLRSRYKNHYYEVHLKLRNHHCDICNKSFKRNYLLMQHPCYKAQKLKADQEAVNNIDNTNIMQPSNA